MRLLEVLNQHSCSINKYTKMSTEIVTLESSYRANINFFSAVIHGQIQNGTRRIVEGSFFYDFTLLSQAEAGLFRTHSFEYERADFRLPAPNVVIFLRNPRITRNLPSSSLFFFFFFFRSRIQCHTGARVVDLPNAGGAPEYRNQAGQTRMLDKWPETCKHCI